ncbi:WD40 repeat domain-containing protein [Actinocorallia sp. B10E7]|uniref:WD40 repeat domain-containing protein n=1 Tax=Actinocorallia sp. B10E7 TaxID=3153558 RepID=UPI00325DBD0C
MTGQRTRKRASSSEEDLRWGAEPGAEPSERPQAPVLALLALTDALIASHADGHVIVHPVGEALGAPWELCRTDPPLSSLAFCGGELVGASGNRLVRVAPDGTMPDPLELDAPVGAVISRAGRVYAVAGDAVHTFEDWRPVHRTPIPLSNCHDLDVDRRGKHVVVCERPGSGYVVELGTGIVVGHCGITAHERKTVTETYARFSPVTDNLYRASSRAHRVTKLARLGKSGRALGWKHNLEQPSTWCTPLASSPDGRYVASRQSGTGVLVWDLRTERQVVFAELDDARYQEKFTKRMRREPVAVQPFGDGSVKVSRWAALLDRDGEATAVAVAPGARYAAVGGRDGTVTVIDVRTRRIERSDGLVQQPACLSALVEVGDPSAWSFTGGSWIGFFPEREPHVVDLATGQTISPDTADVQNLTRRKEDEPKPPLPDGLRASRDGEHAVAADMRGWKVFSVSDLDTPLHVVDDLEAALAITRVDLAAGLVAGQDYHTKRLYVWTVDGEPVASFDGFGEARASGFAFADGALWMMARNREALYRLDLP